jgi:FAD/FMN-containing dehydrogenase
MAIIEQHGVDLHESGLWIQPELFSMRLGIEDRDQNQAQLALQQTVDELLRLAQDMGGSMEYTHGVGVKLAPFMSKEHGYGLEIMRGIKKMLDPNYIMNPGKMGL